MMPLNGTIYKRFKVIGFIYMLSLSGLKLSRLRRLNFSLRWSLAIALFVCISFYLMVPSAMAALEDDRYDGDIYALYAGNGSLIPPRSTLQNSLKAKKPTVVIYYLDDSSDCKTYSLTVSRIQEYYGRAMDISAVRVDALPLKEKYEQTEEGYYYKGYVPQTVIFDATGKVVLDEIGNTPYEKIDDTLRTMFDLVPRTESNQLKRRRVNEVSTEFAPVAP
jgi:hypothetical protein